MTVSFVICFAIIPVYMAGFISGRWIIVAAVGMFSTGEIGKVVMRNLKADLENAEVREFAGELREWIDKVIQGWPKIFHSEISHFQRRLEVFFEKGRYHFLYRDAMKAIDEIHALIASALDAYAHSKDDKARECLRQAREKCSALMPEIQTPEVSMTEEDKFI